MKFGIAIIFYNPDQQALKRIKNYAEIFEEVIVIDNSEIENKYTLKSLEKFPNCLYHSMNGNKGMAEALNYAFNLAIKREYDFLLTMDQDSDYSTQNINNMLKYIEVNFDDKVGIYSPNYSKLYYDLGRKEFIADKPVIASKETKSVSFCMTSGSFVKVEALRGMLPLKDYFIAYVDNYLSAMMIENGYKLLRVGESYFSQQVGGVINNNFYNRFFKVVNHTETRYYYMFRNNFHFKKRFGYRKSVRIKSEIYLLRLFLNIVIGEKKKMKKIKACIIGFKDYRKKIYGVVPDESMQWK